jgi:protein TonB
VPADGIFNELEVDRPVMLAPGVVGPSYPDVLRAAGIDGTVLAQFVVDTLGRVDVNSFVALRSDHALFTNAVRAALGRMRFLPAEAGGRKVRQLVQQPFQFSVTR